MRCISKNDIKNGYIHSSHCLSRLVQCISFEFYTFLFGGYSLFSPINPQGFASLSWTYYNPKFEKWKNTKKWPRCHIEAGKSCRFIPDRDLRHDQKPFHSYSSLNFPEMRPLSTYSQFYQVVTLEMMTLTKILVSVFIIYSHII